MCGALALNGAVMRLLRGLGRHPGAVLGAKRLHRRAGFPVFLNASLEVLNVAGGMAVEMTDIGPATLLAGVAGHAHPLKLAVHFRQAVDLKAGGAKRLRELGARVKLGGNMQLVARRQPGTKRL